MQTISTTVERTSKNAPPVESREYGPPMLVTGPEYEGEQAVVEAGGLRVTVSPEYDGVWTWIRGGPRGLAIRVQVCADGTVHYHEDRAGCPDAFEARTADGEPAHIG